MNIKSKALFLSDVTGGLLLLKLIFKNLDVTLALAVICLISLVVAGIVTLKERRVKK